MEIHEASQSIKKSISKRSKCEQLLTTVTLLPASPWQVNNVAELLLVRGLAQVVKHRGDEERSGGRGAKA